MNADLSAGLVGLALGALLVFLGIQAYAIWQRKKMQQEYREETRKTLVPLRVQAYERLVLFLERISPEQLIARMPSEGRDAPSWYVQQWITQTIREEFQHNITQQLYVEESTWIKIKEAADQLIWQVNQVQNALGGDATGRLLLTQWVSYRLEQPNLLEEALVCCRKDVKKDGNG